MAADQAREQVLVFGGRGFIGAQICREVAARGLPVLSVGRSDKGPGGELGPNISHRSGVDALKPETYEALLQGARAVVISIGEVPWAECTWGSKDEAVKMNGLTNTTIIRAAAAAKVPRIILVNATMPSWGLIQGYREGKDMAAAEAHRYPETSGLGADACTVLIVKPSVVAGTRYWGRVPLPLKVVMAPLRLALTWFPGVPGWLEHELPGVFGGVLKAPAFVEEVARACADHVGAGAALGVRVLEAERLVGYR